MIGVLTETQGNGQFLMAQIGMVGREIVRELTFVVAGSTADSTFQEPLSDAMFRATAQLANLAVQGRNMDGLAEPVGQQWTAPLLNCFHVRKLS